MKRTHTGLAVAGLLGVFLGGCTTQNRSAELSHAYGLDPNAGFTIQGPSPVLAAGDGFSGPTMQAYLALVEEQRSGETRLASGDTAESGGD